MTLSSNLFVEARPRLRERQQTRRLTEKRESKRLVPHFLRENLRRNRRRNGAVGPAVCQAYDEQHGDFNHGSGLFVVLRECSGKG